MDTCLTNGVITKSFPFDGHYFWQPKCPDCGTINSRVINDYGTGGISKHTFICPNASIDSRK